MTKWIILIRRDNRRGNPWEIASECLYQADALADFKHYRSLLGDERVRLYVDYFQLQAGDV